MIGSMKIRNFPLFIHLLVACSIFPVFARQERQKEYVQVVNVELILRVLKDGAPVGGLKKSDFSLYEDGENSELNGFFEIHRRMAPAAGPNEQLRQGRVVLLFFWVGNPAADVEGVLNRFFSSIYREGDRVILSTPLKTFELSSRQDLAGVTSALLGQWRREAMDRLSKKLQFREELNRLVVGFLDSANHDLAVFSKQYSWALKEYQLQELSSDTAALEAMARSLVPIQNDKFALVFFQRDTLPLLDTTKVRLHCATEIPETMVSALADAMIKIEAEAMSVLNVRRLSEELKSLFIQANTQFHLLFLSPEKNDGQADAASSLALTRSQEIFSNWDQVMQEISKTTGGLVLDGDRMVAALDQVAAFEDIYYHVTYVPREQGATKRRIDVRVNQPGLKVIYGRTLERKDLPRVRISEISANDRLIHLSVVDFCPFFKEGIPAGSMQIDVTGKQGDAEPPRLLLSREIETTGTVELPIAFPQPGAWDLQVQVIDRITGQQDVKMARVEIAAAIPAPASDRAPDPALIALLAKAAAYAEKLKKAAFHFICREEVTEDVFGLSRSFGQTHTSGVSRTYWIYDYQIIGQDEKITENRILLEKNREKLRQEKVQLQTRFRSLYSFYMPATILAREKQHLYHYRLINKKKKVWHIAVVRRDPALSIPWGEIWVNEGDGSVLKIQLEQNSIVGFEELAKKAGEKGLMPAITIAHEYDLERNQIRFPSRTVFIERYNAEAIPTKNLYARVGEMATIKHGHFSFERSRTYFEYRDYKFFSVSTRVTEKVE